MNKDKASGPSAQITLFGTWSIFRFFSGTKSHTLRNPGGGGRLARSSLPSTCAARWDQPGFLLAVQLP